MARRLAKRLLIVGWDAADWQVADPLLARGQMPNLARLVAGGVRAELRTLEPKLSPLLWSSIATGKTADRHGILNFVEPNPSGEGVRVASSTSRRTKALWNIASQSGLRSVVVGWYASHPAEPVAGAVVSNLFLEGEPADRGAAWPLAEGSVHPAELRDLVAAARVRSGLDASLRELLPDGGPKGDPRVATLAKEFARARSLHAVAKALVARRDQALEWDLAMVFHDTIDTIGHHFMEFRPPRLAHVAKDDGKAFGGVMDAVYRMHDRMLGELLEAAGPETTVILLSDHGFHSDHLRPVIKDLDPHDRAALESSWHRMFGVLVASGPGFRRGERIAATGLLDIVPTALVALGLPVGEDLDGRVIVEAFESPETIAAEAARPESRVASWDSIDGPDGRHPAEMRQDPFEARDALQQLVDLGYLAPLGDDQATLLDLVRRETDFNLAVTFMTTHRPSEAIPAFARLVDSKPDEPRFVLSLARCQVATLRFDDAIATLGAYLGRKPDDLDGRTMLAAALAAAGREAEARAAIAALESRLAVRSDSARTLGDLCAAAGLWTEAIRHHRRAVEREPRDPNVRLGLARALLGDRQWEPAAEACLEAMEIQQALPEGHLLLGVALAWLGMLDPAVQSLEIAVRLQPGLVEAHRMLAAIHRERGSAEAAGRHAAEAARGADSPEMPRGATEWSRRT
jgi:tetratricopeptide (TPR) repeat protein